MTLLFFPRREVGDMALPYPDEKGLDQAGR